MKIKWYKNAVKNLLAAIEYLENNHAENYAEQLELEVLDSIKKLPQNPLIHPQDRFITNNDGTYRAFVIDSYRISYRVINHEIQILRIKHTSRKPKNYKR